MKYYALIGMLALTACGQKSASQLREAWNDRNDPSIMDINYLTNEMNYTSKFSELPKNGELSTTPWSDTYYPTYRGGITNRWQLDDGTDASFSYDISYTESSLETLSPAEKYDIFLGRRDMPLTNKERERTQVMRTVESCPAFDPNFTIPTWEGLCHAWAPATISYKEPKAVTVTNAKGVSVPFASSDIKALLTYFLHETRSRTQFLGGRCNKSFSDAREKFEKGTISKKEYLAIVNSPECKDVNAGSFHVVLANQIGRNNEGFVFDVTRDAEVWNQAVYSYSSKIKRESRGGSRGAAPGTVRELEVETTVGYIVEVAESVDPNNAGSLEKVTYRYTLELNADGEIIGGRWIENGLGDNDRPDFLWKREVPAFGGFYSALKAIYEEATK